LGKRKVNPKEEVSPKSDSTVKVAIIGGIVTVLVTVISAIAAPMVLKAIQETPASPTLAGSSQTEQLSNEDKLVAMANENLSDVRTGFIDTFDTFSLREWSGTNIEAIGMDDGALKVIGQNEQVVFWRNNHSFPNGRGLVLRFKYTGDSDIQFSIEQAGVEYDEGQALQIWGDGNGFSVQIHEGAQGVNDEIFPLEGNLKLQPDIWYGLLMVLDTNGKKLAVIWDLDDPSLRLRYIDSAGHDSWRNLFWDFEGRIPPGVSESVYIDDYTEISFSSFK